ncbi:MAG: elongation factor P [Deltaproteobacteria bacterium]|nr:elongation factor P [Deltaproteobacteria bacterium]
MMIATQIRAGMILDMEGTLYRVMHVDHLTPGNKRGIIQTQLRNLTSGNQEERRFGSDAKVERAILEQHLLEFLYADESYYHFMNTDNFEQLAIAREEMADLAPYLLPNMRVDADFHEGRAVGISLPAAATFTVVEAEPTVKKATASATYKQATMETGLVVKVPNFIQVGDTIKVDTTTGAYLGRE